MTACYSFRHALYQQVVYQRLAVARRLLLTSALGISGKAYEAGTGDIAAQLAVHFSQGRDHCRTVQYLRCAAENAAQRYANREAMGYLIRALGLVDKLPQGEQAGPTPAVLAQRAKVCNSMGDLRGAAEDFTTLAAYAHEPGQVREVKAWLAAASVLSWVDRARCGALERAVALSSNVTDALLRAPYAPARALVCAVPRAGGRRCRSLYDSDCGSADWCADCSVARGALLLLPVRTVRLPGSVPHCRRRGCL